MSNRFACCSNQESSEYKGISALTQSTSYYPCEVGGHCGELRHFCDGRLISNKNSSNINLFIKQWLGDWNEFYMLNPISRIQS